MLLRDKALQKQKWAEELLCSSGELHGVSLWSTLSLPLCHLIALSLERPTTAVWCSSREASGGGRYGASPGKCILFSVCRDCAWTSLKCFHLVPLDFVHVQFEDKGVFAQDFQMPGHVVRATRAVDIYGMCMYECRSWSALAQACTSCIPLAVHVLCHEREHGHSVLP